jgi:hypothetical protein
MTGGLLTIVLLGYFVIPSQNVHLMNDSFLEKAYLAGLVFLVIVLIPYSYHLFQSHLKKIRSVPLSVRMEKLRKATLIRISIMEGIGLLGIAGYLIFGSFYFMVFPLGGVILMLFLFPTDKKISRDTKISLRELQ